MSGITHEVKKEILDKVKSGESVSSLASQYDVSNRTIYSWLKRKAVGTVSLLEYNRLKRENQQLKEIIGDLRPVSGGS